MKKILAMLLAVTLTCGVATACDFGSSRNQLVYPDHGYADASTNSWEQLTAEDEIITVSWFADYTAFGTAAQPGTLVYNTILEKTKCRISFTSALSDDGQQLTTMVSGNKMPDIVTVTSADRRVQLA